MTPTGLTAAGLFIAAVAAANVAAGQLGPVPVGFGLLAPAGVYFAGLTFTVRDWLQDRAGLPAVVVALTIGVALSWFLAGPELAAASAAAFAVSETLDTAIYTPLRRRSWLAAVALSGTAGAVADSVVFLTLSGFGLAYLPGQVLGKTWTVAIAAAILYAAKRHRRP